MATLAQLEPKGRRSRSRELPAADVAMTSSTAGGSCAAPSPTLSDVLTLLMGMQAGQDQILRTVQRSSERIERVEHRLVDVDQKIEQHETRMASMEQHLRDVAAQPATSSVASSEGADTGGTRRSAPSKRWRRSVVPGWDFVRRRFSFLYAA